MEEGTHAHGYRRRVFRSTRGTPVYFIPFGHNGNWISPHSPNSPRTVRLADISKWIIGGYCKLSSLRVAMTLMLEFSMRLTEGWTIAAHTQRWMDNPPCQRVTHALKRIPRDSPKDDDILVQRPRSDRGSVVGAACVPAPVLSWVIIRIIQVMEEFSGGSFNNTLAVPGVP